SARKFSNPTSPPTKRGLDSVWPWCNKSSLLMAGKLHASPTNHAARSSASRTSNSHLHNQLRSNPPCSNRRQEVLIHLDQRAPEQEIRTSCRRLLQKRFLQNDF